ncbi:hypothetical protein GWI33_014176 [Rhynchophorus ferrugineus]|uniref:Uncharacterized protein n=1 Tax=Rhynchophorus ferrugineus TaxID=354439 RepID=A0A834I5J8_RHYFE|nr:hypothetical protein GWI33_014176 [Rhynchophorus ferrugineus]
MHFTLNRFLVFLAVMGALHSSSSRPTAEVDKTLYEVISNIGKSEKNLHVETPKAIEYEIILSQDNPVQKKPQDSGTETIKSTKDKNPNRKISCVGPVTLMAMCF